MTKMPISALSAHAMDDFLTKPVNQHAFRAHLQTTLNLKHTVDRRIHELKRLKDHFAKYVPEAVKRLVAANPEAPALAKQAQDVSVLFVDISGYARMRAQLTPDVLNRLVEQYFSTFLDCMHAAGGDISETAGDGLMAIFPDGDRCAHAVTAVETALTLLRAMEALHGSYGTQPLAIHIGLNSGLALVGSTRLEGLRGTRWTFTANGPVTNLAARLAATAGPDQLLLGPETVRRLGDRFRLQRFGHTALKNFDETVEICRVLGAANRLYDPYPFPWHQADGGLRDAYGQEAWRAL